MDALKSGFHCIEASKLERFLERRPEERSFPLERDLAEILLGILRRADEFVPSAAGSILLDDPAGGSGDGRAPELTFIATFGSRAERLIGHRLPTDQGIAGHVYRTGKSHLSTHARGDEVFDPAVDDLIDYQTEELIAVPISIDRRISGVLELINRRGEQSFSPQDRKLLEIFADYISVAIQNVLDGRQAQEIAKRDNLTGLYNDRYLHIALSRAIEQSQSQDQDLAVLFLDLDFFKRVNDTHGHLAGSQVLQEVGALLGRMSRPVSALPARYGGDEFVIVVPDVSLERAVDLAEEIRDEVRSATFCSRPGSVQSETLDLKGQTCSIGVATLRQHIADEADPDRAKGTLLRLADAAMYVAKETGRNRTAVAGSPVRRR